MNKEELDINQELEQMRQDYAALKEQFDKQQIINDHLLKKTMTSNVGRIFMTKKLFPLIIVLLILMVVMYYKMPFAPWFKASIFVFSILLIFAVPWLYEGVRQDDIYNGDILSTAATLRKFKKRYVFIVGVISAFLIFVVIYCSIYTFSQNISRELMIRREVLIALMSVAALFLEYHSAKRLLKSCDDIINTLKMKD